MVLATCAISVNVSKEEGIYMYSVFVFQAKVSSCICFAGKFHLLSLELCSQMVEPEHLVILVP